MSTALKTLRSNARAEKAQALKALRNAVLEGATWQYEHLLDTAMEAGATDADIDQVVYSALEMLFSSAEQPVTARNLAGSWPV